VLCRNLTAAPRPLPPRRFRSRRSKTRQMCSGTE
jgi:hypothetical protein